MATLWILLFVCLALGETVCAGEPMRLAGAPREGVILIHGLGRSPLSMLWLKWTLQKNGYQVINVRYPSRRADALQVASANLDRAISKNERFTPGKIHFVTHSFGGIIVRSYLANHAITNLGRVVMLAPPNHGVELADHLRRHALGRWILGPIGREMGTTAADLPARLGPAHFPLGIIAADGPGIPWDHQVRKGPSDGIVSVKSARLEGMSDFEIVHGSHTLIIWRRHVSQQVLTFLKNGHFS